MATDGVVCVNREVNLRMCPCTNEGCPRRGICCDCVQAHHAAGKPTACMNGAQRAADSLELVALVGRCNARLERNLAFCPCDYQPCSRKGTCCDCVRNHFNTEGTGRVACMRGLA